MAFAGARSSPRKQRRQPTAQISHLSAETTCKRIQAEKDHERDLITRLYQRRAHVYQQIDEYHRTLDELDTQLRHAMQSEAFLEADEIRKRREQIETKLWDMFISTERQLDDQIQQAWDRFASLLRRDAEAADQVVETSREVKSERERQILQYRIDCEQKCEQRLQRIHAERDGMEQEKSQIAFDLEMWEHADNDFKARMDELVHDDKAHKTDLLAQADTVQIVELKERLQNLSRQHADLLEQVETLDARMQAAVQPYASEQNALHADYNQVQQRKQDLDARTAKLDLEDEDVHAHLDRMRSEEQRGQQELDALEDMILRSQRTADEGRAKTEVMTVLGDVLKARDSLVSEKKGEMAR
ncbi:hypothetical protein BCR43DRAFT_377846 [Syncephalastrum racemosum]|uniref:Uncharacterized protein n=1 Tax=Syncephalastrum racemosum TaxID=13706 RepID=A0A1X2H4W5_SYNRA|nr:hypothetical protein BCR43DRAFT_377846 [Syncephalastrum racemosum]